MTPDTRAEGFVAGARKIVQILRYGPRELALALLGFLLLGAIPLLPKLLELLPFRIPALPWVTGVLVVFGLFLLGFAVWRIWKKAVAPLPEAKPKPAAIKGPAPFGPQDAELFARLGRNGDLNKIRDWILDDQKSLVALMGESGVGKTSLLRAGLAHHLQDDKVPVFYWEAVPTEPEAKLLHAVQELWEEKQQAPKTFDGLASAVASGHRVVVIDQAEQLSPEGHPRIFELLRQVAAGDPPYRATWVVAFRREFLPVWRDFELSLPETVQRRMETRSLQRFFPKAAEKVIAVLAEEGSLPVDQKLIEELVEGVAIEGKVSPADIGISLLVLSELAGGRPDASLSLDDFREGGGQVGLLTRYLEKLLELFLEAERPEVLRGLLSLVDLEKDQRLAEGRTLAELEESVKPASPPRFAAALRFFASGKARVLEELPGEPVRYRLVHERLIPAIRKLTGVILAEAERAGLALERGYRVWAQDRRSRYLLHRWDLKEVLRYKNQIRWGKDEADKRELVRLSLRRTRRNRYVLVAATLALLVAASGLIQYSQKREHQSLLATWGLPPDLYDHLGQLEELTLPGTVTRLDWLSRAKRLKTLTIEDGVLESLQGLPSWLETLRVGKSRLSDLSGLPTALTSFSLGVGRLKTVEGLPSGLRSLELILDTGQPRNANFKELTNLQILILKSSKEASLSLGDGLPAGIRSLELKGFQITSLKGLPRNLQSLAIFSSANGLSSSEGLPVAMERLKHVERLAIKYPYITIGWNDFLSPIDFSRFPGLRSLDLHYPEFAKIAELPPLSKSLTHLAVSSREILVLGDLTGLKSLKIRCELASLTEDLPQDLESLELEVGDIDFANHPETKRFYSKIERHGPKLDGHYLELERYYLENERHYPKMKWQEKEAYFRRSELLPASLQALTLIRRNGFDGWRGRLPPSLKRLNTFWLPDSSLPAELQSLLISGSDITQLPRLPEGLTELSLRGTEVRKLPGNLRRLTRLDINETPIDSLDGLPPRLEVLSLSARQVETLDDLPSTVIALHFHGASGG